jgi:glutamine phosphoribosylpyrophosphate amidotransferase
MSGDAIAPIKKRGMIFMCGIAGMINAKGMDMSANLIEMLQLIQHRGMDASGLAIYGFDEDLVNLRVSVTDSSKISELYSAVSTYATIVSEQKSESERTISFIELTIKINSDDIAKLHSAINSVNGLCVHSLGKGMRVYKDRGTINNLLTYQKVENILCTHGIGHVRMATESAEDINAAHPFVSPFYPNLSIVHNGQFTNYFNLRRTLENKKAQFKTLNDSEAASHLIAYRMMVNGGDLQDALKYAAEELDGIFCIIAATSKQIGFVKDKLGIKPLLIFEDNGITMFGSEQIEFTKIFPDVYADEVEPGEVRVWNI